MEILKCINDDEILNEKVYLSDEEIENELVEASRILSRHTPIRIRFIHVPNNSYSKAEIVRDIELLRENEKMQVVGVVADYLKGFKPMENSSEMRLRIDNITSDLRSIAIECDVAVITASQVKIELSNEITKARSNFETSVIPKDCPETVFSESKGVVECADFAIVFAQTANGSITGNDRARECYSGNQYRRIYGCSVTVLYDEGENPCI